jgi:serine protease inhibitor
MLLAGAAGDTASQLAELLDASDDPAALHKGLGALLADLSQTHSQYTLSVANRLWAAPGLDSSRKFVDITRDDYNSPTETVRFSEDPEAARSEINHWVSDQTAGKIDELLRPGQIDASTVMAIVNAIYFKADWAKAFDASLTRSGSFRRADGTEVSVELMSTPKTKLRTAMTRDRVWRYWLELPYRTGEVSFLAYSSQGDQPVNVQALQAEVDAADLEKVVQSLEEDELVVQMPRFSLRSRIDLVPIFEQLGVTDLFDGSRANLSGIDARGGLYVGPFVHEATVRVDEHGTVAAAATAAALARSAPRTIIFDSPFVFLIRDNRTGAVLFTGRVADPTSD